MRFDEALRYLLSLGAETLAIKLGLRNTELLLAELNNPQKSYPSVQIAGTNGKGSTAVVLDSICRTAGIKTGLYTSPHLVSITERISVAGRAISTEDFARYATQVQSASQDLLNQQKLETLPTFFEQVTAIALVAFREAPVELAILETGLGGRLDATSVAQASLVAITPIAFDHEEYLGKTLKTIAAEKAAIIRPGVTAIIAPQPPDALEVILQQGRRCGVKPSIHQGTVKVESTAPDGRLRITLETDEDSYQHVLLGVRGRHQVTNVATATRLAESLRAYGFDIPHSAIAEGIERAHHPGRLELWTGRPSFLFDGAHNASGTQALREYLDEFVKVPITLVFGAMRDKNLEDMAEQLFPVASRLVLTEPDNPRAARMEVLERVAASVVDSGRISLAGSVREAIQQAREFTSADGLICFSGSLYLIGEAQATLKEEKD